MFLYGGVQSRGRFICDEQGRSAGQVRLVVNCRQIPPNTACTWNADSEAVIRRVMMEVVKTITVKGKRPDGSIIVLTFSIKVKR